MKKLNIRKTAIALTTLAVFMSSLLPSTVYASTNTSIPQIVQATNNGNSAYLKWGVPMISSNVRYTTNFDGTGAYSTNTGVGLNPNGHQTVVPEGYNGSYGLKVLDTWGTNGNEAWWQDYNNYANVRTSRVYIPGDRFKNITPGENFSLTMKIKTSGNINGMSFIADGGPGRVAVGFDNPSSGNYVGQKIYLKSYAPAGATQIYVDKPQLLVPLLNQPAIGIYTSNYTCYNYQIKSIDVNTGLITLGGGIPKALSQGSELTTYTWHSGFSTGTGSLNTNGEWKTISFNAKVSPDDWNWSMSEAGLLFMVNYDVPPGSTLWIDDIQYGNATTVKIYRDGQVLPLTSDQSLLSEYTDTTAVDNVDPQSPSNLSSNYQNGNIRVSWNGVSDIGHTYSYAISSVDKYGVESSQSPAQSITVTSGLKNYEIYKNGVFLTSTTNNYVDISPSDYNNITVVAVDNVGNKSSAVALSNDTTSPVPLLNVQLNGQTGQFSFENNQIINTIGGKVYTGTGTSFTTGKSGNALQITGGTVPIPLSDLGVDSNTQTVSTSFWFKWNGDNNIMPVGFDHYDAWLTGGFLGFNTAQGDVYGINNPYVAGQYVHTVLVFNKNDYTLNSIYINGVKQALSQKQGSPANSLAVFQGSLNISGWLADGNYKYSGSAIDDLRVFNRALSDSEVSMLYNNSTPTAWTNQPENILVSGSDQSGTKQIQVPNNNWVSSPTTVYTVGANGTYTFNATDNIGNVGTQSITVSNIDTTAPTLTVTPNTTGWVNGTYAQKHTLRLATYAFNTKETQVTPATYLDGNVQQSLTRGLNLVAYDSNFNVIKNVSYDTYATTSLGDNLANDINSLPNGSLIALQGFDAFTLSSNLRTALQSIGVPNASTMNTDADSGVSNPNQRVTFQFAIYKGETTPLLFDYDRNGATSADNTIMVGNANVYETINSIDTASKPNTIVLPNGNRLYNNSLSLTNVQIKYLVFDNGTYSFSSKDIAGNSTSQTGTVSNIDPTAPTLTLTASTTAWTSNNVIITASATDGQSGVASITKPDGSVVNGSTATYSVGTNGTYSFTVKDAVGNSTTKTITVNNIDTTPPQLNLSKPSVWSNSSMTITVTASDSGSGLKQIVLPNGNIVTGNTATYTVTDVGVYYFSAIDNVGNSTTAYIIIDNIDKNKPTTTINNSQDWSNKASIPVTITGTDN